MSELKLIKNLDAVLYSGEGIVFIKSDEPERVGEIADAWSSSQKESLSTFKLPKKLKNKNKTVDKDLPSTIEGMLEDECEITHLYVNMGDNFVKELSPFVQLVRTARDNLPLVGDNNRRVVINIGSSFELPSILKDFKVLELEKPNNEELKNSLSDVIGVAEGFEFSKEEQKYISSAAKGLQMKVAEQVFAETIYEYRNNKNELTAQKFFDIVSKTRVSEVNKVTGLELMKPVGIENVGGLEVLKEHAYLFASCLTKEAEQLGITKPKGILLAGPPGTGKSLSAQAIASVMNTPLVKFDLSALMNKYVGETESNMRNAIATAKAIAPCVMMVDEVDKALSGSGSGDTNGVNDRMLGTLLTEMQENKNGIFFVFTANNVQGLPAPLLRAGRIDGVYAVNTPNKRERYSILSIHLNKRKIPIPSDIELAIEASNNYVPAELESAIVKATWKRFSEQGDTLITGENIRQQLNNIKPLYLTHSDQFNKMEEWARDNAINASEEESENFTVPQPRKRTRSISM